MSMQEIKDLVEKEPGIKRTEVPPKIGLSIGTVVSQISKLVHRGELRQEPCGLTFKLYPVKTYGAS